MGQFAWKRWELLGSIGLACCVLGSITGCASALFRGTAADEKEVTDILSDERTGGPRLIGELATPVGTNYQRVEGVALATQLDGTGSDPPPSPMRDLLKKEMQTHNVRRPEERLKSVDSAMVIVRGYIPPGAVKDDTFDVEAVAAPRTDTTSLAGGWLLQTRLRQTAILDNDLHTGHVAALATGPIVVDAMFDKSEDSVLKTRGRVLMGGIVTLDRTMGLTISSDFTSVKTSSAIGAAINERFHDFDRGSKKGLANPTRDDYLELKVHSRYKQNLSRYLQVIANIAVSETPVERIARIAELEKQLLEPTTAQLAALQLEAIGKEALLTLRKGLASSDPEVRFYAAEALAYLDDPDSVSDLYEAARNERALRWRAMTALSVVDQYSAQEALMSLMSVPSAETRYGAFCALRARHSHDPMIKGEVLNDHFSLHTIGSTGEPMIHISRARRPEIVLFGFDQKLESPNFLFAGPNLLIMRENGNTVRVSKYASGNNDQHEVCSNKVEDVLRAVVKLGGGYPEAIQAIQEAKAKGFLQARVEVDALPHPGRIYRREDGAEETESFQRTRGSPDAIPDIFVDRLSRDEGVSKRPTIDADSEEPTEQWRGGWLDRMTRWMVE